MVDSLYTVAQGSTYEAKLYSAKLFQDTILSDSLFSELTNDGVIIRDESFTNSQGGVIQLHNQQRLIGAGNVGDDSDLETSAINTVYDTETMYLGQSNISVSAKAKGSITAQRLAFDMNATLYDQVVGWHKQRFLVAMINQLACGAASSAAGGSITFDGATYTSNDRNIVWGHNAPLNLMAATNFAHRYIGSGSQTNDAGVQGNSSFTLALNDFNKARKLAMTQFSNELNMQPITGKPYDFVALVSVTGMNQLIAEAQSGGNITLSSMFNQQLAGGMSPDGFLRSVVYRGIKYIEVPDHYMPIGYNSSPNTTYTACRHAVLLGRNAMTFALGQGYTDSKGTIPGFNIVTDYKPLKQLNITACMALYGMKLKVYNGLPVNAVVIGHYYS